MMPCRLEKRGEHFYCLDHHMFHYGHLAQLALDPSDKGMQYRRLWSGLPPLDITPEDRLPRTYKLAQVCEHRGVLLDKTPCGAELWHCRRNKGTCSLQPDRCGDSMLCQRCPKWLPPLLPDDGLPRHLLYHLWPRKGGIWQRNLDEVKKRWSLFTGKKTFAIVSNYGEDDSVADVMRYMEGYDCDFIPMRNDPRLREVKTFYPLFSSVKDLPGYTFYGHAKGVTHPDNPGVSIHRWTDAMYETLLDYWPLVQYIMSDAHVVGSFKKSVPGAFAGSGSGWHYSGSFCWFKNSELFARNWEKIEQVWYGIETYPSMIFSGTESGTAFYSRAAQFDLYTLDFWRSVEVELEAWRREYSKFRSNT